MQELTFLASEKKEILCNVFAPAWIMTCKTWIPCRCQFQWTLERDCVSKSNGLSVSYMCAHCVRVWSEGWKFPLLHLSDSACPACGDQAENASWDWKTEQKCWTPPSYEHSLPQISSCELCSGIWLGQCFHTCPFLWPYLLFPFHWQLREGSGSGSFKPALQHTGLI